VGAAVYRYLMTAGRELHGQSFDCTLYPALASRKPSAADHSD
jgi:hypothetical protein